jgi:hypothetical protein
LLPSVLCSPCPSLFVLPSSALSYSASSSCRIRQGAMMVQTQAVPCSALRATLSLPAYYQHGVRWKGGLAPYYGFG